MVSFLNVEARTADPECITTVIGRLGNSRDVSAVPVLIRLLDFQRPLTQRERAGITIMRGHFPAVSALFSIGLPAVPVLVKSIRLGELNPTSKKNAVEAVATIFRENPDQAVALLMKAARESTIPAEKENLESSAHEAAAHFCGVRWREKCANELMNTGQ
jgi:hypothetical protein